MSKPNLPIQRFNSNDVLKACEIYGTELKLDPTTEINGTVLLKAFASVESSMGLDCGPRYEDEYDEGGSFWKLSHQQRGLVESFGGAAACSYGPWQMMYVNFPWLSEGPRALIEPKNLLAYSDYQAAISFADDFIKFFNSYAGKMKPQTVREIGDIWNTGHMRKSINFKEDGTPILTPYEDRLIDAYTHFASL